MKNYNEMNDWLFELENYGMRVERLYEDIGPLNNDTYKRIFVWLEAAFLAGKYGGDEYEVDTLDKAEEFAMKRGYEYEVVIAPYPKSEST